MSTRYSTPAILFEPDGYVLSGPRLMGRQAAGNAFLRATVAERSNDPLFAYTRHKRSADVFRQLVQAMDAQAQADWIPADRLDLLAQVGALYLPGPELDDAARLRLRVGCGAYSLVGVTHTTASHAVMDSITGILAAPVMPWDALICTSTAVAGTVNTVLNAEIENLRWRLGTGITLTLPQLPVIPLGVHCGDFKFSAGDRAAARAGLGIGDDEVVALFVGRLSLNAKAHPHAMYSGLQAAAERTGKKVTLLQSGWFANDVIKKCFSDGAAQFCPIVKAIFTDGRDAAIRRQSWAAADVFISLSDNIQETFGLTPIEAMAAGLPVVVTDWNGYKDTVRDGVDGFRIPTWMPPPNLGELLARGYESGADDYDFYCGLSCQTVAADWRALAERLSDLIANPDLRRSMGGAGQVRAREVFDWAVVYRQYQAVYRQLAELRGAALANPEWQARLAAAPEAASSRMDPFRSFGHYPTALIQPGTLVAARPAATRAAYEHLAAHDLFNAAVKVLPAPEVVERLLASLQQGMLSAQVLAERTGIDLGSTVMTASVLAKMGLVRLVEKATGEGARP